MGGTAAEEAQSRRSLRLGGGWLACSGVYRTPSVCRTFSNASSSTSPVRPDHVAMSCSSRGMLLASASIIS